MNFPVGPMSPKLLESELRKMETEEKLVDMNNV